MHIGLVHKSVKVIVALGLLAILGAMNASGATFFTPAIAAQSGTETHPVLLASKIYLPLVLNNYKTLVPPPTSTTYYVSDPNGIFSWCNNEGLAGRGDVVVILDFGQPWYANSTYGTKLFDTNRTFISVDNIEIYIHACEVAYVAAASINPGSTHLTLGVGTSNYNPFGYVTREHGQAWAQMINNISYWIAHVPCGETTCDDSARISVVGANDIEPSFGSVASARAWVDGYDTINECPYYNYGACESCPFTYPDGSGCPLCTPPNNWTLEDIWYVSWGAPSAWALPEIYNTYGANAWQWQNVSLYSYVNHGRRMSIKGAFTQWQACQGRSCDGIDNRPEVGWRQLYEALNSDARTAQDLPWLTDITWDNTYP